MNLQRSSRAEIRGQSGTETASGGFVHEPLKVASASGGLNNTRMRVVLSKEHWRTVYTSVCSKPEFAPEKALIAAACQNDLPNDTPIPVEFFDSAAEKIKQLGEISGSGWMVQCAEAVISTRDLQT